MKTHERVCPTRTTPRSPRAQARPVVFADLTFTHEVLPAKIEDDDWVFPRSTGRIRRKASALAFREPGGLMVQYPEIVLLHKSRAPRPEEHADFHVALPHLDEQQRRWLTTCIEPKMPDTLGFGRSLAERAHIGMSAKGHPGWAWSVDLCRLDVVLHGVSIWEYLARAALGQRYE